jgi:glycosyltransferase involved in cell wall biosynthesis
MPLFELNSDVKLIHLGITNFRSLTKRVFSYFEVVKKISHICGENSVDIIMGTDTRLNILLAFVKNTKLIKIACEHNIYRYAAFYTSILRRLLYPRFDAVVLLTRGDTKNYPFCKNVKVIPNALPFIPRNKSTTEKKTAISAGRLHKIKGFDLLIEAVSMIRGECNGWVFKIFGEGEEYEDLTRRIKEKNLEKTVEIHPKTDNMEQEYCKSGFYVLCSRYESFGLVLIEAKSCGLPAVSFNCPEGPAGIIRDGTDGILVESGNTEALSRAILTMIKNPRMREEYGRKAAEDAKRFYPQNIFDEWKKLFMELEANKWQ